MPVSFVSLKFIAFFVVAAAGWYLLPQRLRRIWLLAAGYVFYAMASAAFALLIAAGTLVSYLLARAAGSAWLGRKTLWTALGVVYTLGVLFVFKYFNFFCASILPLFGAQFSGLRLALPIGVSFFSFAICGYLFDVHSGKLAAERDLIDYANFVIFFPVLLAGPIGRAREFLPQLKSPASFDLLHVKRGALRFLWGAFKKMVVADALGILVDAAYADPSAVSGGAMLAAALAYSLQIYFDFSAYSDMAIGCADALGFRVMENFSAPYLSRTVKSFWKKWHNSLTGWFREYLYFPLGGSRKGRARTQLNVLIVFAVSGLWHGADWSFVFWGLLNGVYQVVGGLTQPLRGRVRAALKIPEDSGLLIAVQGVLTFLLLTVAWIFFRAGNMEQAVYVVKHILLIARDGFGLSSALALLPWRRAVILACALVPCVVEDVRIARGRRLAELGGTCWRFWGAAVLLALLIALFGVYGEGIDMRQFVYFQF